MSTHWKILIWLLAGAVVGGGFQFLLEARSSSGLEVASAPEKLTRAQKEEWVRLFGGEAPDGVLDAAQRQAWLEEQPARVVSSDTSRVAKGQLVEKLTFGRGTAQERTVAVASAWDYRERIGRTETGSIVFHHLEGVKKPVQVVLALDPECQRARWIEPFAFLAEIFMRLLKMLIVPLILTSIVTGVVGVGTGRDLRKLGTKTFAYYASTSLMAIIVGLVLVNLIQPGEGASLGLDTEEGSSEFGAATDTRFVDVIIRMVPENVFEAFSANGQMLQVIFFAILFGYFILRSEEPHRSRLTGAFESTFEVMMKLAGFVLSLIPYGAFCLLVKVVGETGFEVFKPLLLYMGTVFAALCVHLFLTLPLVLRFVGRIRPVTWFKAMMPALMTAFSTSSSSMTLPVSMDTVEKRGKVSNRVVSFVQPLGATINMDGTALYECIGVIFLAQYYSSAEGASFALTLGAQVKVVLLALLASVGAAGIPSAGLIMMTTILTALGLPTEGALLLLAVDRPLDMMRTCVNVFSDTGGSAVVARTEGERPEGSLDADDGGGEKTGKEKPANGTGGDGKKDGA